jgi:LysR family transcriptional regulator (chromosome initiation inhibitor)
VAGGTLVHLNFLHIVNYSLIAMLDYSSLAAVATVVQEGSFERAARVLNVTPSAISQRIKLLEERLGTVLVARGQPCTATDTGRLLCRHIEQVAMLEQDLRGALPNLSQPASPGERVTLRVAVNADSLGTWFTKAIAAFRETEDVLLDVSLDDQEYTVNLLRSGHVLAAVTANAQPVQGCNSTALGKMTYVAVASPSFIKKYFRDGVTAGALAQAPTITFNRIDRLQGVWARRVCRREVDLPTHWLPSTQSFIDGTVSGIGWGMNPLQLVRSYLDAGVLVELVPGKRLTVPLYWQHSRLQVPMLGRLTKAVIATARATLG